jgi:N-acetylglucosaminyldiphosphoundecaprenol N-acetyl-beta-D-mannosaminyltransferase
MTFEFESTAPVLGTPVAMTRYEDAVRMILECAAEADRAYLVAAANTHLVTLASRSREYAAALAKFDFIVPDGMPLIWYLNFLEGADLTDRVYGPELMSRCLAASGTEQRHFFLGSSDTMRERLQEVLQRRFPELTIVGGYSPPFGDWDDAEDAKICRAIRRSEAQLVWVGLGCPRQEEFLARMKDRLPWGVYLAVGAAFSLISGAVPQAPKFLQKRGLEWAFRLWAEPRRLWRRYLVHNSLFVWGVLREVVSRRR